MTYRAPRNPIQLTPEDHAAIAAHIRATVPADGPELTGYVGGRMPVTLARNQWRALPAARRTALAQKRREARA